MYISAIESAEGAAKREALAIRAKDEAEAVARQLASRVRTLESETASVRSLRAKADAETAEARSKAYALEKRTFITEQELGDVRRRLELSEFAQVFSLPETSMQTEDIFKTPIWRIVGQNGDD